MLKKSQTKRDKPFTVNIRKVEKTSISDDIVDQIMSLIARGDLKPGQQLPSERELCKQFGAGRSSLREALRCLCIVGQLSQCRRVLGSLTCQAMHQHLRTPRNAPPQTSASSASMTQRLRGIHECWHSTLLPSSTCQAMRWHFKCPTEHQCPQYP